MRRVLTASLVTGALLVGAIAGKAATASNGVPAGTVGQGSTATSPYTISGVGYTLWYTALPELAAWRAAVVQLIVPVLTAPGE